MNTIRNENETTETMTVLIGCEESQAVTLAFRNAGHEAYSCDFKACSGGHPEWHIQGDVFKAIASRKWDFIGLHPTCTKMTLSGNRHYGVGKPRHYERLDAVEWTINLWQKACAAAEMVYMENPLGAMNGDNRLPKPQIVQPFYFGDSAMKTTCLWLHGLPFLYHNKTRNLFDNEVTHVSRGEIVVFKSGKSMPKWYADAAKLNDYDRAEIRSKTFPGIANAMATQWSKLKANTLNQPICL